MSEAEYVELRKGNGELKQMLLKRMPKPGKYSTPIEGFFMSRRESDEYVENCFYKPSIGLVVQGNKRSIVGDEEYKYGENQCLVVSVDMPSSFFASGATPEQPFLAVSLDLDSSIISRLIRELPPVPDAGNESYKGVAVTSVTFDILNAFLRLTELLDHPEEIAFLAPGIIYEIHYRFFYRCVGKQPEKIQHSRYARQSDCTGRYLAQRQLQRAASGEGAGPQSSYGNINLS